EPRRPHRPGQPGQLVQVPPHAGARARLPDRRQAGGTFAFWRPDGTALPSSPPLPEPAGAIGDCHEAEITEDTIIPPWYGERLDLDHAIYTCLANARTPEERQAQREPGQGPARDRVQVFEPEGWPEHR